MRGGENDDGDDYDDDVVSQESLDYIAIATAQSHTNTWTWRC